MKYQIPFTLVGDLIKRITNSWTATKTTDDTVKMQSVAHEVDHAIMPVAKKQVIPIKNDQSHLFISSDNDYCSTY